MVKIPKPTTNQVKEFQDKWSRQENYVLQERSLKKLFTQTYPQNTNLDDILIKVCSLNDFYSTNIFSPFKVAKHIFQLSIDDELNNGDLTLVPTIANISLKKGKKWNFYSFASKYCSHHKPDTYPIYDRYVDITLRYFRKKDRFERFNNDDLKEYSKFVDILSKFTAFYNLEGFSLKEIDRYLWQLGKKYFPRKN